MSMDAFDFVKAYQRMCKAHTNCSKGCPLHAGDEVCTMITSAQDAVDIVEKWAKEHPVKTRQSEFLKQWPSVKKDEKGVLLIHPCDIDTENYEDRGLLCPRSCDKVVVLPCKVGDTVYLLFAGNPNNPVISTLKINTVAEAVKLIGKMGMHKYIGTFLTREEAEKALEAMEDV